ncbi:MAG: hypothetical protein KDD04_06975 [Sinomicrobium sp.]|nr:hypothetical protein [Sinomicrobium sp.]
MKYSYKFLVLALCLFVLSCGSDDNGNSAGIAFLDRTWNRVNSGVFSHSQNGSNLTLELTKNAVWLNGDQGGLFYTLVNGDFDFSATVRASKKSDAGAPPDSGFSFGGLMVRASNTAQENYVHLVAGTGDLSEGVPYGYEYKVTSDDISDYEIIYDGVSEYDLRLVRSGNMFTFYYRPAGSDDAVPWNGITTQPLVLPSQVQLGFSIYSGSNGALSDLKVTFSNIRILEALTGS